jgi:hypothetical protein
MRSVPGSDRLRSHAADAPRAPSEANMTRDELEAKVRERLTAIGRHSITGDAFVAAILQDADAYATTQARAAIDALYEPPPAVHWLPMGGAMVACDAPNVNLVNTTIRDHVTCDLCRAVMKGKPR